MLDKDYLIYFLYLFIFIFFFHFFLYFIFHFFQIFQLKTRKGSISCNLLIIEIISTLFVIYFTLIGFKYYFLYDSNSIYINILIKSKFYSNSIEVIYELILPMLAYQIWNLIVCLLHNEYRDIPSILHHIVTIYLGYCGLYPFSLYYAIFYFGIAEITTIPLNIVNVFKNIPHLNEKYPTIYNISRTIFAISFFIIRLFWWPIVSYDLFFECLNLLQSGKAHSNFVVCYFLFSNLFLTGLQFYWGYIILVNAFKKKDKHKKKQNKTN